MITTKIEFFGIDFTAILNTILDFVMSIVKKEVPELEEVLGE